MRNSKRVHPRKINTTRKLIQPQYDVVLMGSSIIKQWKLTQIFGLNTIKNNGISGLLTKNLFKINLNFSNPKFIILYCGGNDLRKNISHSTVIQNINKFVECLMTQYPNTKIILVSILMSPSMVNIKKEMNIVNKWYNTLSKKHPTNIIYINVNRIMNIPDYYDSDGIHLNNVGYDKLLYMVESSI